ncbi:peptidylprolyl isomerase [Ulvibacter sp. MAR_2010_11]|uniref:peptidylprolyl isomerase n=1 Tax=Ulvibacter sp. MAR_2010_11 TaxID=1250229 RepID=UPI000C2C69CF|nr:peptidylprolyl isomerase [Ulvibacter sp. MAR_2010_11]PKA83787.1 peptidylprolyl isomerase [Ulvibacter sp. MAR_2010_11]
MKKLTLLFLVLSMSFAACQDKYPDLEDGVYAEFITNKGTFVAKLYNEQTPLTVANFVALAEGTNTMVDSTFKGKKFYNGLTFHRVMKDFMIQGGDPKADGTGNPGYIFPDEIVDTLKHDRKGILSMANGGPDMNGSQFFITLKETPWLDGRHSVFGEIVIGQEVVDSIGSVEVAKPSNKPVEVVTIQEVNIINRGNVKLTSFTEAMENIEKEKAEEEARIAEIGAAQAKVFAPLLEQAETLPSGLKVYWNHKGKGMKPADGAKVLINYAGFFTDGRLFDTNRLEVAEQFDVVDEARKAADQYIPVATTYSANARLVAGFREALLLLSVGDKVTVLVPSHLGYGAGGNPPVIPPNSDLIFELELTEVAPQ